MCICPRHTGETAEAKGSNIPCKSQRSCVSRKYVLSFILQSATAGRTFYCVDLEYANKLCVVAVCSESPVQVDCAILVVSVVFPSGLEVGLQTKA